MYTYRKLNNKDMHGMRKGYQEDDNCHVIRISWTISDNGEQNRTRQKDMTRRHSNWTSDCIRFCDGGSISV